MHACTHTYAHVYTYSGTSLILIWTLLGRKKVSFLVISEVAMYSNRAFGTAKCILFIEMSSFQGVLVREVPLYAQTVCTHALSHCCTSVTTVTSSPMSPLHTVPLSELPKHSNCTCTMCTCTHWYTLSVMLHMKAESCDCI